jgi:hypothetical protein
MMIEGQRLALEAILEALRNVAGTTEAALLAQGDAKDDVTKILGFELTEIQNHIRRLEGRLASLDHQTQKESRMLPHANGCGTMNRPKGADPAHRSAGEDQSAENTKPDRPCPGRNSEEQGYGDEPQRSANDMESWRQLV